VGFWILKEGAKGCLKIVLGCHGVGRRVQNAEVGAESDSGDFHLPAAAPEEEAGGRKETTAAEGGVLPPT